MSATEINRAVARRLGAWVPEYSGEPMYRPYSTSIEAAWEIVEWIHANGGKMLWKPCFELGQSGNGWLCRLRMNPWESAETAPMAICLAFLKLEGEMAVELSALQAVKAEALRATETALRETERRKFCIQEARQGALEEAAKVADRCKCHAMACPVCEIAQSIRALKEKG